MEAVEDSAERDGSMAGTEHPDPRAWGAVASDVLPAITSQSRPPGRGLGLADATGVSESLKLESFRNGLRQSMNEVLSSERGREVNDGTKRWQ